MKEDRTDGTQGTNVFVRALRWFQASRLYEERLPRDWQSTDIYVFAGYWDAEAVAAEEREAIEESDLTSRERLAQRRPRIVGARERVHRYRVRRAVLRICVVLLAFGIGLAAGFFCSRMAVAQDVPPVENRESFFLDGFESFVAGGIQKPVDLAESFESPVVFHFGTDKPFLFAGDIGEGEDSESSYGDKGFGDGVIRASSHSREFTGVGL